jgi:hypothetical protein
VVQRVEGFPLRGDSFSLVVVACAAASLAWPWRRAGRGGLSAWPLDAPHARALLASMVVVPWILLAALTPKIYWENFNGDGAHAYEATRLLLHQAVPFFGADGGEVSGFPGTTSVLFAFPNSWFLRLFGEYEASVRLPLALYLIALCAALHELALWRGSSMSRMSALASGTIEVAVMWLALIVYAVVIAYSATYNPYAADIALPATQDTLLVVCFLAFVLAFARAETGWLIVWTALTYVSLPNGALLLALWMVAAAPWAARRRMLVTAVAALAVCVIAGALLPLVTRAAGLPPPGEEYGGLQVLRYFAFLQLTDWRRLLYAAVPAGILPALGLVAWRRHDDLARALTLVTAAYFLFFYIQAYSALHHYVPAMLLPLAVFWRDVFERPPAARRRLVIAAAAAGFAALWVSLPRTATVYTAGRHVGETIEDRTSGYTGGDPRALRRAVLLRELLPLDWDPRVPHSLHGGSELTWNFYARRRHEMPAPPDNPAAAVNYVLQDGHLPAPPGMRLVATNPDGSLYVRDEHVWMAHRELRPSASIGSRLYEIPRGMLFRTVPPPADGPTIISVIDLLRRAGVDTRALLDWLGVG